MKNVPFLAPIFSLKDELGDTVTSDSMRGRWLVLYFYPKDDTPGCTTQACSLRDARDDLVKLGAQVVGISKDTMESHAKFREKHDLNFILLSDPDGAVIETYGAWGPKMFGKIGIQRKTFIIDPDGVVQKVFGRATPLGHGDAVIAELKRLQAH